MIQIIKHGYQRYEITCPFCECRFSFDERDTETIGHIYDKEIRIHCPDCHKDIEDWDIEELVKHYG